MAKIATSEIVNDLLHRFPEFMPKLLVELDVHVSCIFALNNAATGRMFGPFLPALVRPFREMSLEGFAILLLHVSTSQCSTIDIPTTARQDG